MSKHIDLGQYTVDSLGRYFDLVPKDLGEDARRSKRGMTFETKSWEIRGIGHLCVMRMNAFFGLMKMETIVIAPFEADLPLYNADQGSIRRPSGRSDGRALVRLSPVSLHDPQKGQRPDRPLQQAGKRVHRPFCRRACSCGEMPGRCQEGPCQRIRPQTR